jgi:HEAT repeat protein
MANKKNRYLSALLLTLSACNSASNTADKVSWQEQIKQSVRPVIAWFNGFSTETSAENTDKKSDKANDENLRAQAQLIGVMENVAAVPPGSIKNNSLSGEDIAQLHQDYDKATTADDKRDALVSLIEVDANNAATLLRDAYADQDPDVRREAVLQMHAFNNQAAVVDLLLKALGDAEASVVIEAVEGLAQLRDPRAIAGLKKVATTHPDEQIRVVAQDYVDQLGQGDK